MKVNRVAGLSGLLLVAVAGLAQSPTPAIPVARVADDARVLDRVAEASKRDLPADLLRRIVDEDIDALRGKRTDDTYQYAGYERMESVRTTESYSVDPERADQLSKLEVRGDFAYRLIVTSPARRLVVTKNRRVWLDHAEIEYLPQGSRFTKIQTVKLGVWLDPAGTKTIEIDEIARHATARLFARADKDAGYGNVDLTLLEARVFDDPSSPYADAVSSLKAIHRALDHEDVASVRTMAQRVAQELAGAASALPAQARASVDVVAPQAAETGPSAEAYGELQSIEDLLTGNDAERRQGLDRLHQLVRKLRPLSH
jgi:hypothetical protein